MKVYVCHYAAKTLHAREWKAIAVENLLLIRKRFITSTLALSASCHEKRGGEDEKRGGEDEKRGGGWKEGGGGWEGGETIHTQGETI